MQPKSAHTALIAIALTALAAGSAHAQTLRGSPASVDLMYTDAHSEQLMFLRTTADIYEGARSGALKLISITNDLDLERTTFPFVLPNTLRFADSLAAKYHEGCGERIIVTSGARPIDKQPRNASPKSVHPTGMALDFRKPQNPKCLEWLRKALVDLEDRHVVEATEERHPPHFHVAVLKQLPEPKFSLAAAPASPTGASSGKIRSAAGEVALSPSPSKRALKAKKKAPAKKSAKSARSAKKTASKKT